MLGRLTRRILSTFRGDARHALHPRGVVIVAWTLLLAIALLIAASLLGTRSNGALFEITALVLLSCLAVPISFAGRLLVRQGKLNRTLRLVCDCKIAMDRVTNERNLFEDLCRLAVQSGGYRMALVEIGERDGGKAIRTVAQFGHADEWFESLMVHPDRDQDGGHRLTGPAIRSGSAQVVRNRLPHSIMRAWRHGTSKQGTQAIAALPFVIENQYRGVLTLYSEEPESFLVEEVRLLEELAGNLTYGLNSLRVRSEFERNQSRLEQRVEERSSRVAALNGLLVVKALDAESANVAKRDFLATMSHEIRTPLAAVVGLSELLGDSSLDRRQREYVDRLQFSAQALRVLVDDILDFSKIEAGALQLEQAPFSLSAIVRTTSAILSAGVRGKSIEALFDLPHDLPDALMGDAVRLQQILLNLVSNAIKFTEAGEIVVSVQCLARDAGSATLQFTVRDTGIGIPPDKLGQVFDAFAQADSSTTRRHGGTGLGLAISAHLARLMGAHIGVESAPGKGSKFYFVVELALAHRDAAAAEIVPSGLSILIIDDHHLAREFLQRTCTAFGWQATALGSALAGLDELRRSVDEGRDYDLVMLDWHMPGMDGIEMLRRAYADPDIGLPQVVLMPTVWELAEAAAAGDDLYLDGILVKPTTPEALLEAVRRTHAGDFTGIMPSAEKTDRRLAGKRLLVAEDNAIGQQVVEQVLKRAGAEVMIVANGMAAIDALRSSATSFDAILMDIHMPVMDGYTSTRIIREEMGFNIPPIVALTARAQEEDRERTRAAGMAGHLVKPIDIDDLLDIMANACEAPGARDIRWHAASPGTIPIAASRTLDVTSALKAFGGDKKKYGDLLREFIAAHHDDVNKARHRFDAADLKGAAELLHGLCGLAHLLQAPQLAGLSGAAEAAVHQGRPDAVLRLLDELQMAMHALAAFIERSDMGSAAFDGEV